MHGREEGKAGETRANRLGRDWEDLGRHGMTAQKKNKVDKKMTEETKNVDVMWVCDVRSTGRC